MEKKDGLSDGQSAIYRIYTEAALIRSRSPRTFRTAAKLQDMLKTLDAILQPYHSHLEWYKEFYARLYEEIAEVEESPGSDQLQRFFQAFDEWLGALSKLMHDMGMLVPVRIAATSVVRKQDTEMPAVAVPGSDDGAREDDNGD